MKARQLLLWFAAWALMLLAAHFSGGCGSSQQLGRLYAVPGTSNAFTSAQPTTEAQWKELQAILCKHRVPCRVHVGKLNRESEGSDQYARNLGWDVTDLAISPYTDAFPYVQELFRAPSRERQRDIIAYLSAIPNRDNWADVWWWHCVHGEDRTERVTWEYLWRYRGWKWSDAKDYAVSRGFHRFYFRLSAPWPWTP